MSGGTFRCGTLCYSLVLVICAVGMSVNHLELFKSRARFQEDDLGQKNAPGKTLLVLVRVQVAGNSHLARQEDAHEGSVGVYAAVQEQQVRQAGWPLGSFMGTKSK